MTPEQLEAVSKLVTLASAAAAAKTPPILVYGRYMMLNEYGVPMKLEHLQVADDSAELVLHLLQILTVLIVITRKLSKYRKIHNQSWEPAVFIPPLDPCESEEQVCSTDSPRYPHTFTCGRGRPVEARRPGESQVTHR